jgi:hypothetical protein
MSFVPVDRVVLKAIAFLVPFWAELAGALMWGQPVGGSDAALAVVPLVFIVLFCVASAWYVYSSVRPIAAVTPTASARSPSISKRARSSASPSSPSASVESAASSAANSPASTPTRPSSDNNSRSRRLLDGSSDNNNDNHNNNHNDRRRRDADDAATAAPTSPTTTTTTTTKATNPLPRPQMWVEASELFVPRGMAAPLHRRVHRLLQTRLARLLFVGDLTWWNAYSDLARNMVHPGPGPLTQFEYVFHTYLGPTIVPSVIKKRRSRSSSSSSASPSPQWTFDVSRRLLLCPCWIFVVVSLTLVVQMIGGPDDVQVGLLHGARVDAGGDGRSAGAAAVPGAVPQRGDRGGRVVHGAWRLHLRRRAARGRSARGGDGRSSDAVPDAAIGDNLLDNDRCYGCWSRRAHAAEIEADDER